MEKREFRSVGAAVSAVVVMAVCAGATAFAAVFGVRGEHLSGGGALAWRLSWATASALCVLLAVGICRARLIVDGEGLEVRNTFRTRQVAWPEISGFSVHRVQHGRGSTWWCVAVERRDDVDRRLTMRATMRSNKSAAVRIADELESCAPVLLMRPVDTFGPLPQRSRRGAGERLVLRSSTLAERAGAKVLLSVWCAVALVPVLIGVVAIVEGSMVGGILVLVATVAATWEVVRLVSRCQLVVDEQGLRLGRRETLAWSAIESLGIERRTEAPAYARARVYAVTTAGRTVRLWATEAPLSQAREQLAEILAFSPATKVRTTR